ncbi:hypothetical protein CQW23_31234 [Capsicum baccatum]|uniref:Protein TAR1 n=1 Tax=Capsicum baccatum TaxID=33114 RepID=A0A2G2V853_CAPBA|nr:hypothetical protein CQW23_31234 [Capsicum baccatum]
MKARRGSCTGAAHDCRRRLSADWALPHVCSAWSLPRGKHPGFAARTIAPPHPNSSTSSSVTDDDTDYRHECTMKRRQCCYKGTRRSHGIALNQQLNAYFSELAFQCSGSILSSPPTADRRGTGYPVPSPQSQSFPRSYESILRTSLAYIVPSTRGCSPWRPDAVMCTTERGWHSVLWIFKGHRERTGYHVTCGALPAPGHYLRLS